MSFSLRSLSFPTLAAVVVCTLLAACTSTSSSSPQTQCTSQAYPTLACGSIQSCATGGKACTAVYLALPDGKKFNCNTCTDCKTAQDEAVAACGGTPSGGDTPDAGGTPSTEQDAAPPANDSGDGEGH